MKNVATLSSFSFQHLFLVFIQLCDVELGVLIKSVWIRGWVKIT